MTQYYDAKGKPIIQPVHDAEGFYPCPKCGSSNIGGERINYRQWQRYCNSCGFAGAVCTTIEGSKHQWNAKIWRMYHTRLVAAKKREAKARAKLQIKLQPRPFP